MRRVKAIMSGLILLLIALSMVVILVQDNQTSNSEKALQYTTQTYGTPEEQLEIVNIAEATFPVSGQKLWAAKIRDYKLDKIYGVYIDENGNIVDIKKVEAREREAYANKYGKLEPDLYDRLQQIDDEEKIKVGIWLTAIDSDAIEKTIIAKYPDLKLMRTKPALDADIDVDMEVYEKFYGELTEAKKEAYAAREKTLLDHLKARGFEITYTSRYAPLVYTVLPKDEIMTLQEREDVVAIYLTRTYEPEIDTAVLTIRAPAPITERS